MRTLTLFKLDTLYREPMVIRGFEFGDHGGRRACAIVGSTRGNEVQQQYICAQLVRRLSKLEGEGRVAPRKRVLVVPCVNPFSMNVGSRFWPQDKSDINRKFPGDARGGTTERVAAGLFDAVKRYSIGIQLCSFYMPGDFEPNVRITRVGPVTDESLEMAADFGLPYVVEKRPGPFDTTMLNYNWQVWDTNAFSVYSRATDQVDQESADVVEDAILRFLAANRVLDVPVGPAAPSRRIDEGDLVDVRTTKAAGFLAGRVRASEHVEEGQVLAEVLDALDTHVREQLVAPVSGTVFFARVDPLVQQETICFRIVPDRK